MSYTLIFHSKYLPRSHVYVFFFDLCRGKPQQETDVVMSLLFLCLYRVLRRLELSVFTALSLFIKFCAELSVLVRRDTTDDVGLVLR